MIKIATILAIVSASAVTVLPLAMAAQPVVTNSIGMKLIRIAPGSFQMGLENEIPPEGAVTNFFPGYYRIDKLPPAAGWEGYRHGLISICFIDSTPFSFDQFAQPSIDWVDEKRRDNTLIYTVVGYVESPVTGGVKFEAEFDPAMRLKIGEEIVFDTYKEKTDRAQKAKAAQGEKPKARSGSVNLVQGQKTRFVLEFLRYREPSLRLYWTLPGGRRELIPADALWHTADDHNRTLIKMYWAPEHRGKNERTKIGSDIFNEKPRHKVTISQAFQTSETEITIDQFRKFRPDYPGYEKFAPSASGLSWNDAVAFCEWLSGKEGKPYRLPTEAEWEYVCRAGSETAFSSGGSRPEPETANRWGVKNMHTGVAEWCSDWHGIYPEEAQVDPVGPKDGWFKIIRGGAVDYTELGQPYYARSANRAAVPPTFGPPPADYISKQLDGLNLPLSDALSSSFKDSGVVPGRHGIGFRVVQGALPATPASAVQIPFWQQCVKQTSHGIKEGPDPARPHYRTRLIYPDFAGKPLVDAWEFGIERGYGGEHHNSALQALPNGDLLAAYYNTMLAGERDACVSIMTTRLRHGATEWDMPSSWPDMVDADDEGPVIWNDRGKLWLFWGSPRMEAGYPFQWTTSTDNGATWSPVQFPLFSSQIGPFSAQPINSAFRNTKGTIFLAVDGSKPPISSELFASKDEGRTWYDTGGRTYGRHSCFVPLDNDVILGYGGKQSEIDGFHPQHISRDGGKSYEISASPLPALGGGVRASVVKLASGRIFYVGDMHLSNYRKLTPEMAPKGFTGDGSYAALSSDNGKNWRIRKLTGGDVRGKDGQAVKVGTVSCHRLPEPGRIDPRGVVTQSSGSAFRVQRGLGSRGGSHQNSGQPGRSRQRFA